MSIIHILLSKSVRSQVLSTLHKSFPIQNKEESPTLMDRRKVKDSSLYRCCSTFDIRLCNKSTSEKDVEPKVDTFDFPVFF